MMAYVSGSKEHKAKSDKWLQDAPALRANLLSTPTPKVAGTQAYLGSILITGCCTASACR